MIDVILSVAFFSGLVQRIFNRDKIQDTSLAPDTVLNIFLYRSLFCAHKLQTFQNGSVFFLAHSVY